MLQLLQRSQQCSKSGTPQKAAIDRQISILGDFITLQIMNIFNHSISITTPNSLLTSTVMHR